MSIVLFGYMSLTDTRLISVRSDISPRDGIVGDVEDLADTQVRLSPDILFFARQKTLDELNEDVSFERVEKLINGVPRASFSLADDSALDVDTVLKEVQNSGENNFATQLIEDLLESDAADDILEAIEENSDISDENGEQIDEASMRREAIERAIGVSEDYIDDLNRIIAYYEDPQGIAKSLHEGRLPFTAEALIENLPSNLTEEKRADLEKLAKETLTNLETLGVNADTIKNLNLKLFERGILFFNNMQINGREVSSEDTKRGMMRILKQPALLNEAFATYLPRIMFFMMPFAMFLGILFVRGRKNALMYDHLVHAAYIHAFTYMYLLFLIILSQWTNVTGLWSAFLWGMFIYLPISAKNMFQRGWFKTLWMTYNIAFSYSITIFLIMVFLLASQLDKAVTAI